MTKLMKQQLTKAVNEYCKRKQIKQDQLAVKCGVGSNIIADISYGRNEDIEDAICRKVWQVVSPKPMEGLVDTSDFRAVINACMSAQTHKYMIGVTGDTGMGKTTAIKAFGARENVFYFYLDNTISTRAFLQGLLREMAVDFTGSVSDMLEMAANELNQLENPVLIVDECGKLRDHMILMLHSLRDRTKENCGIVLAGMPDFRNKLIAKANKQVTGYSEFYRRVNLWENLEGLSKKEISYVLEQNGIADTDLQAEVKKEAHRPNRFGDLMNAVLLYKNTNQ